MKFLLLLGIFAASGVYAAPCQTVNFTPSNQVQTGSDKVLIVTHPSTQWDGRFASKMGMDSAVAFAKLKKIPVIYLQDADLDNTKTSYFFSDCNPTYWVKSGGGEFSFAVNANHVYTVGGHWEACQSTTMTYLMDAWASKRDENLTITMVLDGIYSFGNVRDTDPYKADYTRFMEILSYGNPRNSWTLQKLSLLETMGIIKDSRLEFEYLKRQMPDFSSIHESYKIVMEYNGQEEVLRESAVKSGPILKIEYINSLYKESGQGLTPASIKSKK